MYRQNRALAVRFSYLPSLLSEMTKDSEESVAVGPFFLKKNKMKHPPTTGWTNWLPTLVALGDVSKFVTLCCNMFV